MEATPLGSPAPAPNTEPRGTGNKQKSRKPPGNALVAAREREPAAPPRRRRGTDFKGCARGGAIGSDPCSIRKRMAGTRFRCDSQRVVSPMLRPTRSPADTPRWVEGIAIVAYRDRAVHVSRLIFNRLRVIKGGEVIPGYMHGVGSAQSAIRVTVTAVVDHGASLGRHHDVRRTIQHTAQASDVDAVL